MPWWSRTKTYAITHSPTFVRALGHDGDASTLSREMPHRGLLYGVAAQDKLVALFDSFDDFESLARDATQSTVTSTGRGADRHIGHRSMARKRENRVTDVVPG